MFINTTNRFTKFYTSNKNSIDTLLLLVQIVAIAIALLGLLALLGWALAITHAVAWLNKLVEDSLAKPRLLMPAVDTVDADVPNSDAILAEWQERAAHMQSVVEYAETHSVPDWYKEAVALATDALQTVDAAIPYGMRTAAEVDDLKKAIPCGMRTAAHDLEVDDRSSEEMGQTDTWIAISGYTIRELKKMASDRKISKYSNMSKAELILALS
jgi:Rho termination factor, N-terminal domain